jgi:hypothetical protein
VRAGAPQIVQRILAVPGDYKFVGNTGLFKRSPRETGVARIVFDEKDDFAGVHVVAPIVK